MKSRIKKKSVINLKTKEEKNW